MLYCVAVSADEASIQYQLVPEVTIHSVVNELRGTFDIKLCVLCGHFK
jgi:hypothetical protein